MANIYRQREVNEINLFTCERTLKFTQRQRIVFFKQLALILGSGLSLLQGLELMEKQSEKELVGICTALRISLVKGSSLAEAMEQQRAFFSQLTIALTVVGEASGHLSELMQEMADYYEKQEELKASLVKAAVYPLFLLSFSFIMLCFFGLYVLPILGNAYISLQVQPKGLLAAMLWIREADLLQIEGAIMIIVLLGAGAVRIRGFLKERILSFGPIWSIYRTLLELRFCKLLSLMLSSGIDITKAVGMCTSAIGDCSRAHFWLELFKRGLQRGMDIGSAAGGCNGFFSPITIELITVGAATGYLPDMLSEAARIEEQDLYGKLDKLKELLAPCLLLVSAIVVGILVCSVVEPLFGLIGQIS